MKKLQLFLIASVLFVSGCGVSRVAKSNTTVDLEGTQWRMEQLGGEELGDDIAIESDSFTLIFGEDGAIGGKGLCNRILGGYKLLPSGKIDIAGVGTTMMFCPNLELESDYTKALESATRYSVDGEGEGQTLKLYSEDDILLSFGSF